MSLSRVQQQLIRDIKRSPAKAAVLALLCVVALYFWAPLVFGWFGKEKPKTAKTSKTDAPLEIVQTQTYASGAPAPVAQPTVPWQSLVEGVRNDPRMQSVTLAVLQTEPFGLVQTQTPDPGETTQPTASKPKPQLDPAQLGLKLSSTMLGRRRVAVINGRPYVEGSEVEAEGEVVLVVARVTDRSVLLEHEGQRFELTIARQ
jgi:hypothetical protein